ncbi:MAG: tetratricopeptide repeat protein [Nitrosopumilus sp.]|nr:tetratricopeptide repeat protein [Nitrosopumilus sp.]CAI9831725.1 TPR repeat domain containing protein [Nitrosopumilaceae archaeon]MDA7944460.1 tetratricopeptide repeat protein [Nitrosopumilus sp.]MDA7952535.1 tetratricopeptide repeat protein [Nitrosopumilus sp.]MDA7954212.1 tetratricopeptide repeat protein [Nitrosopumilus sp.]
MACELLLPIVEDGGPCLPLAINAVSRYWDVSIPAAEAASAAARYPGGGAILAEGLDLAGRHGLESAVLRSSMDGLRGALDAGVPPVVLLPGVPGITQHASVITGYDDEEGTILHYVQEGRDGEQQEGAIPRDIFEREWSEESQFMIVLAPPGSLPAADSAPDRAFLEAERLDALGDAGGAVSALRSAVSAGPNPPALALLGSMLARAGSDECARHYEECTRLNPRAFLAWEGLGNHRLRTGDLAGAEECYDEAIRINPRRSARVYKNRAYLREKRGDGPGARGDLASYLERLPNAPDRGAIEAAMRGL